MKIWVTKDGTKIRLKDMTDKHLNNIIKMLERKAEAMAACLPYPSFNGEMAQYCAEQEWQSIQDDPTVLAGQIYKDLCEEQLRRQGQ